MAVVNPPQPVPQLGPQPDFVLLAQGFQQANTGFQQANTGLQQAANQLGNFTNLPPIAQGNAIVQQLQQVQQQMQQQTQQQQQFQQQMQHQMQQFQQQMQQQMQQFQQQMRQQNQQFQQQLQQQIQQNQQQTNLNFDGIRTDIQNLRNDLRTSRQASEHNSLARIENSVVKKRTAPLTVFRDYTTNTDIPEFPATPADLENMRAVTLDPILKALDLSLHGDIGERQRRLGHYIGLTNLAG